MTNFQVKRGTKARLPQLLPGEPGLTTDTDELFIGTAGQNRQIPILDSAGKLPKSMLPTGVLAAPVLQVSYNQGGER